MRAGYLSLQTHSRKVQYCFFAFPLQQWLHVGASILHFHAQCQSCYSIPFSTLFSNAFIVCSSLNVRYQASKLCKTKNGIAVSFFVVDGYFTTDNLVMCCYAK